MNGGGQGRQNLQTPEHHAHREYRVAENIHHLVTLGGANLPQPRPDNVKRRGNGCRRGECVEARLDSGKNKGRDPVREQAEYGVSVR